MINNVENMHITLPPAPKPFLLIPSETLFFRQTFEMTQRKNVNCLTVNGLGSPTPFLKKRFWTPKNFSLVFKELDNGIDFHGEIRVVINGLFDFI
jgi:hypothetical protein